MLKRWIVASIVIGAVAVVSGQTLGTITLSKMVRADGKLLLAGTYQVRLSGDPLVPGVGQSAGSERWVEFMKNGATAGREVATIIPASEIDAVGYQTRTRVTTLAHAYTALGTV